MTDTNVDLEQALSLIAEDSSEQVRRQLLAFRCYLRDLIMLHQGAVENMNVNQTPYLNFLVHLQDLFISKPGNRVVLVTFNYDLLLDDAIMGLGENIAFGQNLTGYQSNAKYHYYKPHGSIDWMRVAQSASLRPAGKTWLEAINHLDEDEEEMGFEMCGEVATNTLDRLRAVPAMAPPLAQKAYFQCPTRHLVNLWKDASATDMVITIGWRAKESHFVPRLFKSLPEGIRCGVVGASEFGTMDVTRTLQAAGGRVSNRIAVGFDAFSRDAKLIKEYLPS